MIGAFVGLFIGGLLVGSFLNVVILRYDPSGSLFSFRRLKGRSACPKCKRTLGVWELIPVFSFLFLHGKCRGCRSPISVQYPIVEFLSGAIVAGVPFFLNKFYGVFNISFFESTAGGWYYALTALWVVIFLMWLVMSVIDLREYIIPNEIVIGIAVFGVGISTLFALNAGIFPAFRDSFLAHYAMLFPSVPYILLNRLFAVFVGGGIFYALYAFSRGRAMGFGDVKLALASGLLFGWPDIILVIALSFILGGVSGLISIVRGKKTMKDMIPFAPFFVGGGVLTVFFGKEIVELYFRIFNLGS